MQQMLGPIYGFLQKTSLHGTGTITDWKNSLISPGDNEGCDLEHFFSPSAPGCRSNPPARLTKHYRSGRPAAGHSSHHRRLPGKAAPRPYQIICFCQDCRSPQHRDGRLQAHPRRHRQQQHWSCHPSCHLRLDAFVQGAQRFVGDPINFPKRMHVICLSMSFYTSTYKHVKDHMCCARDRGGRSYQRPQMPM